MVSFERAASLTADKGTHGDAKRSVASLAIRRVDVANGASPPWLAKPVSAVVIEGSIKSVVENRIRARAVPRSYARCRIPSRVGGLRERVWA